MCFCIALFPLPWWSKSWIIYHQWFVCFLLYRCLSTEKITVKLLFQNTVPAHTDHLSPPYIFSWLTECWVIQQISGLFWVYCIANWESRLKKLQNQFYSLYRMKVSVFSTKSLMNYLSHHCKIRPLCVSVL